MAQAEFPLLEPLPVDEEVAAFRIELDPLAASQEPGLLTSQILQHQTEPAEGLQAYLSSGP